jgi:hypothetical protein
MSEAEREMLGRLSEEHERNSALQGQLNAARARAEAAEAKLAAVDEVYQSVLPGTRRLFKTATGGTPIYSVVLRPDEVITIYRLLNANAPEAQP